MLTKQESLALAFNFREHSNLRGFGAVIRDYLFISLIILINLKFDNLFLYLISIWLIGAFQFALSECLLHEASHCNLFSSRKVNQYSEILLALPFFATYEAFKKEHLQHHNFLLKPEDHIYRDYKLFGFLDKNGQFVKDLNWLWHLVLRPFLGISGVYYFIRNSDFTSLRVILFWLILLSLTFYFGVFKELVLFWFLPLIWCCGAFLYWSEFLDHYLVDQGFGRNRTSKIANFIFHNNGYHATHHQYPFIPFFNLKKAYQKLNQDDDKYLVNSILDFYWRLIAKKQIS